MRIIVKENHYGKDVWTHREMDEKRKTECLCRLCSKKNDGYCQDANDLFVVCQRANIALSVTRCASFTPDPIAVAGE